MVQAGMGVGVLPDKVYQLMGRPLGLVGLPLEDDWAERSLVLAVRDVDALSPVSRLLFDHLRTVEARETSGAPKAATRATTKATTKPSTKSSTTPRR
jgi:DNA-binding transcriptional LysR family regulator